jgi:hypothetical protein
MNIAYKFFIVIIIIFAALVIIGSMFSEQCSEIGTCKACWSLVPKDLSSDLCPIPNQTCTAQPYQMQHNALVDLVLCGCDKASAVSYNDGEMNNRIKYVVNATFGYEDASINEICSNPGLFLTYVGYG